MGRFAGHKTSHGSLNNIEGRLPVWFFTRPKLSIFSSNYNKGDPVMLTGFLIADDLSVFL